jgi:hypothetical protein
MASISVLQACSCASPSVQITVNYSSNYTTPQPINTTATCGGGDGGTTTTPTDAGGGGATTGG